MRTLALILFAAACVFSQTPSIEPGVSQELAKWRAAHYSDVRYKLNLTLEKMSPVLKGTMEIKVNVSPLPRGTFGPGGMTVSKTVVRPGESSKSSPPYEGGVDAALGGRGGSLIILDWRRIKGSEDRSTIRNVSINGRAATLENHPVGETPPPLLRKEGSFVFHDSNEHLTFSDGVIPGENVIKLDFTSPILTSGSAITRYVDKEDGAEYIYSLFVPSDASTAFPVFDQPDLKARFLLCADIPAGWKIVSNESGAANITGDGYTPGGPLCINDETKPISTYVFAFAAGPFEKVSVPPALAGGTMPDANQPPRQGETSPPPHADDTEPTKTRNVKPELKEAYKRWVNNDVWWGMTSAEAEVFRTSAARANKTADLTASIYIRKSQAVKFKPHAAEVFRLNREAVKYFEEYFDYKFPFPKYDLVLIPEFPFGGMEHAGATFLREASIIFPQEPTKNDHISRAVLIFHEAAHQWFGDTVTMRWFDDLWLKEGFANFAAYKAMERIMPEANAWKVFYERIKQGAYQTDSTKGTTPIYQEIKNLSAAKSAYGNIVYNKAPAFLRQAEFYLGEDKFRTAVRAFLKKQEFKNAGWEDLVKEFEEVKVAELKSSKSFQEVSERDKIEWERFARWSVNSEFVKFWVTIPGMAVYRIKPSVLEGDGLKLGGGPTGGHTIFMKDFTQTGTVENYNWLQDIKVLKLYANGDREVGQADIGNRKYPALTDEEFKGLRKGEFTFSDAIAGYDANKETPKARNPLFVFPNYQDYGYGIFLLDDKSRDYVLKNIQNEKDPFLRAMMWGSLWDSVREGELDPREYVELVVKVLSTAPRKSTTPSTEAASTPPIQEGNPEDESTIATLLNRTSTALNYYLGEAERVGSPHVSKGSAAGVDPSLTVGLRTRVENMVLERMYKATTLGERITFYRAFLNLAASDSARRVLKRMLLSARQSTTPSAEAASTPPNQGGELKSVPLRTKDRFDIVTRLLILGDADAPKLLADLEKTETSDEAKRYAYAARAGIPTAENKAKYWNDFVNNKENSESWIEAAFGPFNSIRHNELTLPYLQKALQELPNHKRSRKIFFVNGWLGAFIGGQRSDEALAIVNKFLADNPDLDKDLRLKILENVDVIERAVKIRAKYGKN